MVIKLLHIILAGQLFLGTIGVMVNFHLCNNKVESWAILTKAKSCHEGNPLNSSCSMSCCNGNENDEKDGCCGDETETSKLKLHILEEKINTYKINLTPIKSGSFFPEIQNFLTNLSFQYTNYKPPVISSKRPVLFQVFLF